MHSDPLVRFRALNDDPRAFASLMTVVGESAEALRAVRALRGDDVRAAHVADLRRIRNALHRRAQQVADTPRPTQVESDGLDGLIAAISFADALIAERDDEAAGTATAGLLRDRGVLGMLRPGVSASAVMKGADAGFTMGDWVRGIAGLRGVPEPVRAALSEGTDAAGGFAAPTALLPQFVDALRQQSVVFRAGTRLVALDPTAQKFRLARLATDPTAAWRNENAAIAESEPTFAAVDFTPRSLAVMFKVSVELLQDSPNIDSMIDAAIAGAFATAVDNAVLSGSGSAPTPRGVLNVAGINTVSLGANGAQITTFDPFLDALYELEIDNAAAPTAAVMHPRTMRTLRKLKEGTTNAPLAMPPAVAGLPMLTSTGMSITEVQGTSSDCSSIVVANWDEVLLGMRQELFVRRVDQLFAGNGQVAFLAMTRMDVQMAHVESIARILGIKP